MKESNILGRWGLKTCSDPPTYFYGSRQPNSPQDLRPEGKNKTFLTEVHMLQTDIRTGPVEAELQRRELPGTRRESDISYDDASETRM